MLPRRPYGRKPVPTRSLNPWGAVYERDRLRALRKLSGGGGGGGGGDNGAEELQKRVRNLRKEKAKMATDKAELAAQLAAEQELRKEAEADDAADSARIMQLEKALKDTEDYAEVDKVALENENAALRAALARSRGVDEPKKESEEPSEEDAALALLREQLAAFSKSTDAERAAIEDAKSDSGGTITTVGDRGDVLSPEKRASLAYSRERGSRLKAAVRGAKDEAAGV